MLIRSAAETITADELAAWATAALSDGYDVPALRVLAGRSGSDTRREEAAALLMSSLMELGIQPLGRLEASRAFIDETCRGILEERVTEMEALELIHKYVVSPLGHPTEFRDWCYLWDGLACGCSGPIDEALVRSETRRVARETISGLHNPPMQRTGDEAARR